MIDVNGDDGAVAVRAWWRLLVVVVVVHACDVWSVDVRITADTIQAERNIAFVLAIIGKIRFFRRPLLFASMLRIMD